MASPRSLALAFALLATACANGTQGVDSLNTGADRLAGDKSEATVLKIADTTRAGGDFANAINLYRRAHQLAPQDPVPLARLGSALAAQHGYNEAIEAYRQALALAPKDPDIARGLATVLLATNQPQLALSHLEPALKLRKDPRLYSLVGVANDLMGRYEAAQRAYAEGLSLAPDDVALRNNLGLSQALAGNYAEATKTLEALAAAPDATPRTRQNLALAYGLAGETAKAAAVARRDLDEQSVRSNLAYYAMLRGLDQHARAQAILGAHAPAHGTNGDVIAMDEAKRVATSEPQSAPATQTASAAPQDPVESAPLAAPPQASAATSDARAIETAKPTKRPAKAARARPVPLALAAAAAPTKATPAKATDAVSPRPAETADASPKTASAADQPATMPEPEHEATAKEAATPAPQVAPSSTPTPQQAEASHPTAPATEPAAETAATSPTPAPDGATADHAAETGAAPPATPAEKAEVAAASPVQAPAAAAQEPQAAAAAAPTGKTRRFLVQVGAFHNPDHARKLCDALAAKGFGLAVSTGRSPADNWHFCRSASPLPKEEALAMAQRLHDEANSATVLVPVSAPLAATN